MQNLQSLQYQCQYSTFLCIQIFIRLGLHNDCKDIYKIRNNRDLLSSSDALESSENIVVDHYKSITCIAESSTRCNYSWISDQNITTLGPTLDPISNGQYHCVAQCLLRDGLCRVTALSVTVNIQGLLMQTNQYLLHPFQQYEIKTVVSKLPTKSSLAYHNPEISLASL